MNQAFINAAVAAGTIGGFRLLRHGSEDGAVLQGAGTGAALVGVADGWLTDSGAISYASGDTVDVHRAGVVPVEYGGSVTRGDPLTSDANGKAVSATRAEVVQAVIAGGAAGNHTVTGLAAADTLISVLRADVELDTGTSATGNKIQNLTNITSEFTVSAANTINNTAGTNTTGDVLLVTYRKAPVHIIGYAEKSGVSGDIGEVFVAPGVI